MAPVSIITGVKDIFFKLMSANTGYRTMRHWMKLNGIVVTRTSERLTLLSPLILRKQKMAGKAIFFEATVKRLSGVKNHGPLNSIPQIIIAPSFFARFDLAVHDIGERSYQNIACFHFH